MIELPEGFPDTASMLYLTLARRHAGTLLTCDRKLQKLCDELGVECIHDMKR